MKKRLIFCWSIQRGGTHATEHYLRWHCPKSFFYRGLSEPNIPDFGDRDQLKQEMSTDHEIFMLGIEDFPFFTKTVGVRNIKDAIRIREYEGYYKRLYNIVVLRDPFNLIASRMKKAEKQNAENRNPSLTYDPSSYFHDWALLNPITTWKVFAREYLRETKHLPDIIPWSYNRWFVDLEYRKSLSAALGIEFSDAGKELVDNWGSSFDDRKFDGRASEMKVLNRWEEYVDNPLYLGAFDQEVVELSKRIFDFAPPEIVKQIGRVKPSAV